MSSNRSFLFPLSVFASVLTLGLTATASYGQTAALAIPRVQGPVNESQLTTVKGNTLPVARTSVDQGLVPDGTPTGHMLMVLKRSDAQQKALDVLVAAQKDPTSPSYHKWLTPEQLGAQFGVADAELGLRDFEAAEWDFRRVVAGLDGPARPLRGHGDDRAMNREHWRSVTRRD